MYLRIGGFIMVFRSKRDPFYMKFIGIVSLVLAAVLLLPLFDKEFQTLGAIIFMLTFFILCQGFILWGTFNIRYTLTDNYLYIKGGPLRSKIPYEAITKISPTTTSMFVGYRMMSAKNGIEIYYKTGMWGSVQISPENEDVFLEQLKIRCSNVIIDTKS